MVTLAPFISADGSCPLRSRSSVYGLRALAVEPESKEQGSRPRERRQRWPASSRAAVRTRDVVPHRLDAKEVLSQGGPQNCTRGRSAGSPQWRRLGGCRGPETERQPLPQQLPACHELMK
jgi:hypothetical protein